MSKIDIFAPNVRHGGGGILLKQLVKSLIEQNLIGKVYISIDLKDDLPNNKNIIFNKNSILSKFYAEMKLQKNYIKGSKVLFFGNLPPLFPLKTHTILYLHNILLIKEQNNFDFPIKTKLRLFIEKIYLRFFIKNVDEIYVQTPVMVSELKKFKKGLKIKLRPFMNKKIFNLSTDKKYNFIYPSYGYPYKNHKFLINTWIELSKEGFYPSLCLLLDRKIDKEIIEFIEQTKNKFNLNIDIFFNIPNSEIEDYYNISSALIWPSLTESFGMPLIEAANADLPIIASDLSYVTDILENIYLFNPLDVSDLKKKVVLFLKDLELSNNLNPRLRLTIPDSNDFIKLM